MDTNSIASPNDNGQDDDYTRKRGSTTENIIAAPNETNNNNGEIATSTIHKKAKIDHHEKNNNNNDDNDNNNDDATPNDNDETQKNVVTTDQITTKNTIPTTDDTQTKKSNDDDASRPQQQLSPTTKPPQSKQTAPTQKKRKKKKHMDPRTLETRRALQLCCKDDDLHRAISIYDDAVSQNIEIEAHSFYNLLSLCDGCPNRQRSGRVHIGTPRGSKKEKNGGGGGEVEEETKSPNMPRSKEPAPRPNPPPPPTTPVPLPQRRSFAFQLQSHMSRLSLPLNETSYTALLRLLCLHRTPASDDDLSHAERLLSAAESGDSRNNNVVALKLRSYASLLTARSRRRELDAVVTLWKRIETKGLEWGEAEYVVIWNCARLVGDEGVIRLVLTRLSETVSVPSRAMVEEIERWFNGDDASQKGNGGGASSDVVVVVPRSNVLSSGDDDDATIEPVGARHVLPAVSSPGGYTISRACRVDNVDGALKEGCLKGRRLRPVTVEEGDWEDISRMNDAIVMEGQLPNDRSKFQGGGKGLKRPPSHSSHRRRQNDWIQFKSFLSTTPYDAVMDAANVGYYKQNFLNAPKHVDYRQIDAIYRHYRENLNEKMLIVLHERHFHRSLMPSWAAPIVATWEDDGALYKAPGGSNDDWYWLQAALFRKCTVVTNDEMRDHHFMMLSQNKFLRWKERHQVHFHFGGYDEETGRRVVDLKFPDVYSRRIQAVDVVDDDDDEREGGTENRPKGGSCCGLVVPLCMKGDDQRFLDGDFCVDDGPEEETYLCICPTRLLKK